MKTSSQLCDCPPVWRDLRTNSLPDDNDRAIADVQPDGHQQVLPVSASDGHAQELLHAERHRHQPDGLDVQDGDAFIFNNKTCTSMKVLHVECGGLVIYHLKLERGFIHLPGMSRKNCIFCKNHDAAKDAAVMFTMMDSISRHTSSTTSTSTTTTTALRLLTSCCPA